MSQRHAAAAATAAATARTAYWVADPAAAVRLQDPVSLQTLGEMAHPFMIRGEPHAVYTLEELAEIKRHGQPSPWTRQPFALVQLDPVRYPGFQRYDASVALLRARLNRPAAWAPPLDPGEPSLAEGAAMPLPPFPAAVVVDAEEEEAPAARRQQHAEARARDRDAATAQRERTDALRRSELAAAASASSGGSISRMAAAAPERAQETYLRAKRTAARASLANCAHDYVQSLLPLSGDADRVKEIARMYFEYKLDFAPYRLPWASIGRTIANLMRVLEESAPQAAQALAAFLARAAALQAEALPGVADGTQPLTVAACDAMINIYSSLLLHAEEPLPPATERVHEAHLQAKRDAARAFFVDCARRCVRPLPADAAEVEAIAHAFFDNELDFASYRDGSPERYRETHTARTRALAAREPRTARELGVFLDRARALQSYDAQQTTPTIAAYNTMMHLYSMLCL